MLNRRSFIKAAGAGMMAGMVPGAFSLAREKSASQRPPNFVVIFTDDQGYGDVGCFGAKGYSTPHLDAMAEQGMRFTNFHVPHAVCSASRASLLTGCYANRLSIKGCYYPWSREGLNPDEETVADLLKEQGYQTGIFGKWHLGSRKRFFPLQHGFDEFLGLPYSNDMWPVNYAGEPVKQKEGEKKPWKANYPLLPLIDGDEKVGEIRTLEDQGTLTTRYTERAVRFIEKHQDEPFFLYLPHSMPHVPLGVSEKFAGKSEQGMYGDVIMEIDWSVGRILKTLKRLGLDERTLVVFATDNGPWLNYGNHAGGTGGLREGKGTSWEGGDRVPCIMRWPGTIPAGTTCRELIASIDVLPTVAALAGARPPRRKIDGIDMTPLLKKENTPSPREHFFYYYPQGGPFFQLQAVTDGRWKLHFPHAYRSYEGMKPGQDGFPGPLARGRTELALFDLENDPAERIDVKDDHPEIVKKLQTWGETARKTLGDHETEGTEVRPPGKIEE